MDDDLTNQLNESITNNGQEINFPAPIMSALVNQSMRVMDQMVEFKELMMMYSCAIKEIETKFNVLNAEYNLKYQRNPISSIQSRVKQSVSIAQKLSKNNIPVTPENIEANLNDVAGIRVICAFVDDIYTIAKSLKNQDDIDVVNEKDYITYPKPNGYRSYHMIVSVPVFFSTHTKKMKVEVQIRTIAMDFWASLEHDLKYKHNIPNEAEIVKKLKICADVIATTDMNMLSIRQEIEQNSVGTMSDEDLLLEKLKKLDLPIV